MSCSTMMLSRQGGDNEVWHAMTCYSKSNCRVMHEYSQNKRRTCTNHVRTICFVRITEVKSRLANKNPGIDVEISDLGGE